MKFKKGVKFACIQPEMCLAAMVIQSVLTAHGLDPYNDIVITSAKDGKHSRGSKHYVGFALDCRIWEITDLPKVIKDLEESLTDEFDVVLEADHIHIEFDPKC